MFNTLTNGIFIAPLVLFLISTSLLQPKWTVSGSHLDHGRDFKRPDPLNHFKHYNGSFDVRNKHYLASAAFTGVHGYTIAGVWLLCGLGFGIFMIVKKNAGGGSASYPLRDSISTDHHYIFLFLMILLFTSLAILVLAKNQKTLHRTEKLEARIMDVGKVALQTLGHVIRTMKQMHSLLLPYNTEISSRLNSTMYDLRNESRAVRRFIDKGGKIMNKLVHSLYIAHLLVVTINLSMLIAAIVLLLLHWHPGFITIIFCCWILTALCWILTGFDFFLHTFADDLCSVFEDFEQNPENNTLSSMIPCLDQSGSTKTMRQIGQTIHTFINALNSRVSSIYQFLGLNEQEEQAFGFVKICDPFPESSNFSYVPHKCPPDAIPIGDVPNVVSKFTCYKNKSGGHGDCNRDGRFVSEESYKMVLAYSGSIQDLMSIYPELKSLTECTFVKNGLGDIVKYQCRPIRISIKFLWAYMLSLSILMVILVLIWVAKAFQDSGRCFSMWSVTPRRPS